MRAPKRVSVFIAAMVCARCDRASPRVLPHPVAADRAGVVQRSSTPLARVQVQPLASGVAREAQFDNRPEPAVRFEPIEYGARRRREIAAYSRRHYGDASYRLIPKAIVLHFTAEGDYAAVRRHFSAPTYRGERPGVCAHYVIEQSGIVHQLVPLTLRCRHAIGLNDVAIGIELMQDEGRGPSWADRQILSRPAQFDAAVQLVAYLQRVFSIPTSDVIGHAMANSSHYFHDLRHWTNDHTDWLEPDVREFRARLPRPHD